MAISGRPASSGIGSGDVSGRMSSIAAQLPWKNTAQRRGIHMFLDIKTEVRGGIARSAIRSMQNR